MKQFVFVKMFKKSSGFDMNTNMNDCFGINFLYHHPGKFCPDAIGCMYAES